MLLASPGFSPGLFESLLIPSNHAKMGKDQAAMRTGKKGQLALVRPTGKQGVGAAVRVGAVLEKEHGHTSIEETTLAEETACPKV